MARVFIHGDETGNLEFTRNPSATKYFALGTVSALGANYADPLVELRLRLAWGGVKIEGPFHASEDSVQVRTEVFRVIQNLPIRFDITLLEKCKIQPHLASDEERLYKQLVYLHLKYVVPHVTGGANELMLVMASLGHKKRRAAYRLALEDVLDQVGHGIRGRVAFWPCGIDPCLQVADYCAWAVQRKHESGDAAWYNMIASKIHSEFFPFRNGPTDYY
jgi:hypothetical protein